MKIHISRDYQTPLTLDVDPTSTLDDLRKIAALEGIYLHRCLFEGKMLLDTRPLSDQGVKDGSIIHDVVPLRN